MVRYLDTQTAFTTLFPLFRLKGAMYLNVTSRPPIFLWKGVGFEPSVVKNSLQFGASATHINPQTRFTGQVTAVDYSKLSVQM